MRPPANKKMRGGRREIWCKMFVSESIALWATTAAGPRERRRCLWEHSNCIASIGLNFCARTIGRRPTSLVSQTSSLASLSNRVAPNVGSSGDDPLNQLVWIWWCSILGLGRWDREHSITCKYVCTLFTSKEIEKNTRRTIVEPEKF